MAEVLPAKQDAFKKEYSLKTGDDPVEEQGFFVGKQGTASWGVDFRVFFEPKEEWVIESFDKIGFKLTSSKKKCPYELDFPAIISSEELFWWLVDYGYRLGNNDPIEFSEYEENLKNN